MLEIPTRANQNVELEKISLAPKWSGNPRKYRARYPN
jgi:hypothetical protein